MINNTVDWFYVHRQLLRCVVKKGICIVTDERHEYFSKYLLKAYAVYLRNQVDRVRSVITYKYIYDKQVMTHACFQWKPLRKYLLSRLWQWDPILQMLSQYYHYIFLHGLYCKSSCLDCSFTFWNYIHYLTTYDDEDTW